ncbi:VgrG-related protein [Crocosphaera sp.]|uniref:VgrG-related protein n=1 Tax=Crocosphaera sp. TaxID=2729996 RepID=UPI003F213E28|nr:VgrG-related protein [Crocosphaera sp.]
MANPIYIPQIILKIDDQDAKEELIEDIIEIIVEDSISNPAKFSITFNNDYFPGRSEDKPWQQEALFEIGTVIEIGFISSTTQDEAFKQEKKATVIKGEITQIKAHFNSQSQAPITLIGYDVSHRLYRGKYNRSFQNMSDSDIVKKIIAEVGIDEGTIEETGGPYGYEDISNKNGYLFQDNQTNMEFLRGLAERNGFELFVKEGKLNFRKSKADETLTLQWLKDIEEFKVEMSSSEQVVGVEVRAWDYKNKEALISDKNKPSSQLITETEYGEGKNTSNAFQGKPNNPTQIVVKQPIYESEEGDKIAQSVVDEIAREFVTAEGKGQGNPTICPGNVIQLADLGKYSGKYYVTQTRHIYQEGDYLTEFSVKGINDPQTRIINPLSPNISPIHTVLVGIVSNNKDPKSWGRVRVKLPTLTEDHESYWARVVGIGAGSDRGFDCLPEINDEVLVVFENGDIHRPYVIGGVWNGKDKPPEKVDDTVDNGKVRLRTFKTRTGHTFQFVEEDKGSVKKGIYLDSVYGHQVHLQDTEQNIEIKTKNGHLVNLADKEKEIEIKTQKGHLVNLNDQSNQIIIKTAQGGKATITMKAATGDINIKSSSGKIAIEAQQEVSIKAMSAKVNATAKVDITAGGQVNIKGAMINLN